MNQSDTGQMPIVGPLEPKAVRDGRAGDVAADPNSDAPNLDAPNLDAPNLDAPNLDAPNLDAPNLDAPNRTSSVPASSNLKDKSSDAQSAPASASPFDHRVSRSADPAKPGVDRDEESLWWRYGFSVSLVLLVLLIPVLIYAGAKVVLSSNSGKLIAHTSDPTAPGWQAVVDPTPTRVIAILDERGKLAGVTFFALTGDGSSGMIQIPTATMGEFANGADMTLADAYSKSGVDVLREGLEGILGVGVVEVELVEPGEWASMVGRVGTLDVANPDPVSEMNAAGEAEIVFPKGSIDLEPDQVWDYLSIRNADESELNLLVRREAFWRAWIEASVPRADREVPEEPSAVDGGLVSFVGDMAKGQVVHETLPVTTDEDSSTGTDVYAPISDDVDALVARLVPFATGPEGKRLRIEVLDGTGKLDHGVDMAILMGAAGAQIDRVGNASSFDVATTSFVYFDDAKREQVEKLRDALGFGEIVKSEEPTVTVEVTVILGADALGG